MHSTAYAMVNKSSNKYLLFFISFHKKQHYFGITLQMSLKHVKDTRNVDICQKTVYVSVSTCSYRILKALLGRDSVGHLKLLT